MAGVDLPDKLRKGLGQGKPVSWEIIAEKMRPFDRNNTSGLNKAELAEFLHKNGAGGIWFCKLTAETLWKAIESNFAEPVHWIKIEVLAFWTSEFMKWQPRRAKRVRITPESATGYEPLEYLDGTPVETGGQGGAAAATPNAAPQPVTGDASFRRAPEPFTRPPPPRPQPSAAPRGPRPPAPPPRAPTSNPTSAARPGQARPAAPRRPGPRR